MKKVLGLIIILAVGFASARMVEDGFGFKSKPSQEKPKEISTYQKWIGIKSRVEKRVRVFLGVDKTEEIVKARIEEQRQKEVAFENKKKELVEQLPDFRQQDKGTSAEDYQQISDSLQSKDLLPISAEAIPADADLKKVKSGVAVFDLEQKRIVERNNKKQTIVVKVKDIPALNIGQERVVSAFEWELPGLRATLARRQDIPRLSSPSMISDSTIESWLNVKLEVPVYQPFTVVTTKSLGLTEQSINALQWYTRLETDIILKTMDRLSVEEYALVKGLMLEQGKSCHSASGLFYNLSGSENATVDKTAKYYLATCSHRMGLFHQSIPRLLAILNSNFSKEAKAVAIETLLKDVPYEHEVEVGERINHKEILAQVPANLKDTYHYVVMKSHIRQHKFKNALVESHKIPEGSKYYVKAQYAAAVAEYSTGDLKGSLERQKKLKVYMKSKGNTDKNIASLINMNLARFGFQQKQYNLAIANYREIDRSHPLWLESLQEQGWAQLSNGDEPGAIGNMHSLHSPYFRGVFMPVSFSIRTIGYLNLCHYGDAYRSLMTFEQTYAKWRDNISSYVKKRSNAKTYETIYSYLRKRQSAVDGLPETVIREVARRKDFLNLQEHINTIFDEQEQLVFVEGLVTRDKSRNNNLKTRTKATIKELQSKIKTAESKPDLKQSREAWIEQLQENRDRLAFYDFKTDVLDESHTGLKKYKTVSTNKLNGLVSELRTKAGGVIKKHLVSLEKDLKELFRNNEFLRYEVFAGSGQNIRFQAAGGKAEAKRLPSSAIPKGKDFKWSDDGEFWEDEVGYYRSSLKSNCPER